MTKFVFKLEQKGWLKALGLHHALLTFAAIAIGFFIHPHVGAYLAVFMTGGYGFREYGNGPWPPETFEYMDFLSPLIVSTAYLIAFL